MTPPYVNGGVLPSTLAKKPAPKPAAKPVARKPVPKPVNPQAKYINDAVNRLGVPMTDAQIQTNASGQLSPIIAALTASIGRQASAGTQAISGYTSNLQQQLAPFKQSAANIYGGAEQSQAASDAALSAKLQGEGGQQAQDLGARLASINAPGATNAAVGQATSDATGAGNALYGTGSASLANLIAAGAAEQSYAGKLPGIAGLSGLQQTGSLQAQLSGKLADQTGQLQAKVPDIVAGLQGQRSDLVNRRETLRGNLTADQASAAAKTQALTQERQALGLKTTSAKTSARQAQERIDLSKASLTERQRRDQATLTERQRHDIATETTADKRVRVQSQKAARAAATKKNPGLTPNEQATIARKAAIDAEDLYHGKQHNTAAGKTIIDEYTATYQDAIKTMTARYPRLGRKGVLELVNRWYKPGEYGRPKKPDPRIGTSVAPGPVQGHDYRPGA